MVSCWLTTGSWIYGGEVVVSCWLNTGSWLYGGEVVVLVAGYMEVR